MAKDKQTLEEKIDSLLKGREKERILSRVDGLFNLLITLSTFIVGIFISQREFIATNVIISFPLIGVAFSLIFSFIIGVVGMLRNLMKYRMLAYCLLLFLPLWYLAMPILLIVANYLTTFWLQTATVISAIVLSFLTLYLSRLFTRSFEKRFSSLFEQEKEVWKKIASWIVVMVFIILILTIFVAIAVFLAWGLPTLLNTSPPP